MQPAIENPSSRAPVVRLLAKTTGAAAAGVVALLGARELMRPQPVQPPQLMLVGAEAGKTTADPTLQQMRAVLKAGETAEGGCITVAVPQFISQSGPVKAQAYASLVPGMVSLMGKPGAMTGTVGYFAEAAAAIGPAARPMLPPIVKALADPASEFQSAQVVDDVWKVAGNTGQGRVLLSEILKKSTPTAASEARKLLRNTPA